jgi:hypothetical protein
VGYDQLLPFVLIDFKFCGNIIIMIIILLSSSTTSEPSVSPAAETFSPTSLLTPTPSPPLPHLLWLHLRPQQRLRSRVISQVDCKITPPFNL